MCLTTKALARDLTIHCRHLAVQQNLLLCVGISVCVSAKTCTSCICKENTCVCHKRQFQDNARQQTGKQKTPNHSQPSTYSIKHPQHQAHRRTGVQAKLAKQHKYDSKHTRHKHQSPHHQQQYLTKTYKLSFAMQKPVHHSHNSIEPQTRPPSLYLPILPSAESSHACLALWCVPGPLFVYAASNCVTRYEVAFYTWSICCPHLLFGV
jgi:hypothetical protein